MNGKSLLAAHIMAATIAACGVGSPAYANPIHLSAGHRFDRESERNFYRPVVRNAYNRLSQKGKRKRARWTR
ncbi:hypothetical protein [Microbulbifer discodermiae]|uniref:hypothetical protein n=1 Tax=Microbulbifer sp. 2201CG32-9 TaxID=3232309 RepID=UPI00345BF98A